jgi:acetyl-CoA acetyltransferase family protein
MKSKKGAIYIIEGLRTAIAGRDRGLRALTVGQMSAIVFKELLSSAKIKKEAVDEVILGNTVSAGTGQNSARQAISLAGLPLTVPAYTVNNVCGSGLQAVILAAQTILSQNASCVIAAAAESATFSPQLVLKGKESSPVESSLLDGLICPITAKHMGEICEMTAERNKISRQQQDQYAFESYQKAYAAQAQGKFRREIVSLSLPSGGGFADDERLARKTSLERLAQLPPAFKKDGTITAGNACTPADGACGLLLASGDFLRQEKLSPRAVILGYVSVAVDPKGTFTSAIKAAEACLKKCKLSVKDIDLFEVTESFAAQAILTRQKLKIPSEKMNVWGGDLALGHPLATSGARALVTLLSALEDRKKKWGLACACFGGGGGIAMIIENFL